MKREMEMAVAPADQDQLRIEKADWEVALGKVKASVKDARKYQRLQERGM